jgi:hypothetical protein
MTENNELYDHLSAARIVYLDTFNNELDIIRELKVYLLESGFSSTNLNNDLYNFYQYINVPIELNTINNVSIIQDPELNNIVEIFFNLQEINNTNNDNEDEDEIDDDDDIINNDNQEPNEAFNENQEPNGQFNENPNEPPTVISPNQNNINLINVINTLINNINNLPVNYTPNHQNVVVNIGNNNLPVINTINYQNVVVTIGSVPVINNPTYQNVIVTTDDNDLDNLNSEILTCDHGSNCSICMSQMIKDDKITLLKCNHNFHYDCITPYLKEYNYKCPVCRAEVGKAKYNI